MATRVRAAAARRARVDDRRRLDDDAMPIQAHPERGDYRGDITRSTSERCRLRASRLAAAR